ncbi:META domain-containing protein [Pseudomonas sp. R2.Fl]|nr:META domain-containing protein [Pseudomonas sp. R2.Fl]
MRNALSRLALAFVITASAASVSAAEPPPAGLGGTWLVEDIGGAGVVDDLQTTLEIRRDGSFGGNAGCNSYSGPLTETAESRVSFGAAAATRKLCVPAVMDQENRFLEALGKAAGWSREGSILRLSDAAGGELVRLVLLRDTTDVTFQLPGTFVVDRQTVRYECDGGRVVQAEYINAGEVSLALLTIEGKVVLTANVIAGSGARYAGGIYEWWTKGDEATFTDLTVEGEEQSRTCKAVS